MYPFGDLRTFRFQHLLCVAQQLGLEGLITSSLGYYLRPQLLVLFDIHNVYFLRLNANDQFSNERLLLHVGSKGLGERLALHSSEDAALHPEGGGD